MTVYSEEVFPLEIGYGLYTSELSSNIPQGYCAEAFNVVGLGDSMENRLGITYSAVNYKQDIPSVPENYSIQSLYDDDPTKAVVGWPEGNFLNFIRGSNRFGGTISGNNYMRINPETSPIGSMCQYGDITYFSSNVGIRKITAYNWTTPAITFSSVTTGVTALHGMISFKDRLWGFKGHQIYFTNVASVTVAPETWSATTQSIPVSGLGRGTIKKLVPIGNRLLIFTTRGLYGLSVQGEPGSWIFKTLDSLSFATHEQCAFERSGLVYYVDTTGVSVTDGYEVTKLSGSIGDKFFVNSTGTLRHTLNYLSDGMVLSVWREKKDGTDWVIDTALARNVFYSRLDIIAWTEWTPLDPSGMETSLFTDNDVVWTFPSISDEIYTAFGSDPFQFILVTTTRGTVANDDCVLQLAIYDDFEDRLWVGPVASGAEGHDGIHLYVQSGYTDAGSPHKLKNLKYAFAEVFTSRPDYHFDTWWGIDTLPIAAQTRLSEITGTQEGSGTNLVKIIADFHFRRATLIVHSHMDATNEQQKYKNFLLILHTERNEDKAIA
jgi:hypothetical protein